MRTGIVQLPLHGGSTPRWLFERMVALTRELARILVEEFGSSGLLERLSDPFWFQSLGCVLGFDWHSSGLTTTVCGALREALKDCGGELGVFVAGGKGRAAIATPTHIRTLLDRYTLDIVPERLIFASKMAAKVDNAALQDGYKLYHHTFLFTADGEWSVIQQGMNDRTCTARRYHWLSSNVRSYVCEPHSAICCDERGVVLDMTAVCSEPARVASVELARLPPDRLVTELKRAAAHGERVLKLPFRHGVQLTDISPKRLYTVFCRTYEEQPVDFSALLGIEGVGAVTVRALALMAELVYGAPPSFEDPARFAFAHGGKDGSPYPINKRVYDSSIEYLGHALRRARIGHYEKIRAFRRLYLLIGG